MLNGCRMKHLEDQEQKALFQWAGYIPELKWRYGYPAAWSLMLVIAVSMLLFFRRRKWL